MPKPSKVAIISLWRNDEQRRIQQRMDHLLGLTYPNKRFIWMVGNSSDATEDILRKRAAESSAITVIRHDADDHGETPDRRLERLSETVNVALDTLTSRDKVLMIHESDLVTPPDVVERLLALPGDVGAGMVYLEKPPFFYDVYAYRAHGRKFGHDMPYSTAWNRFEPFEVDSVGSCWTAPAAHFMDGIRAKHGAVIDLMRGLKAAGCSIWVDPQLAIIQPRDLWEAHQHGSA